ncbi:hypothetical protein [Deinococcus radiotolerans]|uniref:Uncharacterized protein n=1 Tax=Deinococcus radiotolerans TaxID=1309407 RepID=A0ABQ2FNF4_9DEIO|nr:hypothetical protein [Deinococcus radiotolerans]GGL11222.1 hypothetical protein GCM10010844_32350 [Deinococcus radiotolerans]
MTTAEQPDAPFDACFRPPTPPERTAQLEAAIAALRNPTHVAEVMRRAAGDVALLVPHNAETGAVYVTQVDGDLHEIAGRDWSLLFSTTARPGTLERMLRVAMTARRPGGATCPPAWKLEVTVRHHVEHQQGYLLFPTRAALQAGQALLEAMFAREDVQVRLSVPAQVLPEPADWVVGEVIEAPAIRGLLHDLDLDEYLRGDAYANLKRRLALPG